MWELQKSNILMLDQQVQENIISPDISKDVKCTICDRSATALTEAVICWCRDVENILLKIIQAADYDIDRAQCGIIYIDEIDKITRKSENHRSQEMCLSGEGVQRGIIKDHCEGTVASVPPQGGRKHPHQEFIQIDTSNILFICGGAFDGLEKIIESRIGKKSIDLEQMYLGRRKQISVSC